MVSVPDDNGLRPSLNALIPDDPNVSSFDSTVLSSRHSSNQEAPPPLSNIPDEEEPDLELGIGRVPKLNKIFMKTPCGHSYHTPCLKKWMNIRLECPTCRQRIPLLDQGDD